MCRTMMKINVYFTILSQLSFLCIASSEWIEITQIERKPFESSTQPNNEILLGKSNLHFIISDPNLSTSLSNYENTEELLTYKDEYRSDEDSDNLKSSSILKLFKQVNDNIINFNENNLDDKINHLKELRDKLSYEVRKRIDLLWTNNEDVQARSYNDYLDYNHNTEFSSNEGALMTIGFLTFSVFLIKLVLKLIYTLKYKQRPYPPASSTTPVSIFLKQESRAIENQIEKTARVLQYVQEEPQT